MHVVATAGHVDHGKSTLIQALTGQQPDRLDEERRRGLSIELGYCWTRLGTVGDVAFVDVPGHERFVSTMLAGVGPVPTVLFVVAADDPWMPQAAEHLAVLDALGVRQGVLAVTRSDLGDAGAALARARAALAGTLLAGIPDVVVSGATGEGLPLLRTTLVDVLSGAPAPDAEADVRLWVDRVFSLPGAGTIVTGTLPAGRVTVGDTLSCAGDSVTVRGLQTLTKDVEQVAGVARVSVRLGSGMSDRVHRGDALTTPGAWCLSHVVDVRVTGAGDPPAQPMLHVGSASVATRVRPLARTADGWMARLTLDVDLPWHVGDLAVLRDPGRRSVWGCQVLDPAPPALSRRGDGRRRGRELGRASGAPALAEELRRRRMATAGLLRRLGIPPDSLPREESSWLMDPDAAEEVSANLEPMVAAHRDRHPLDGGITLAEAARALQVLEPRLLIGLVRPPLKYADGRIRHRSSDLPEALVVAVSHLEQQLRPEPFRAPDADTLKQLGLDRRSLAVAARAGLVLRLSDNVVLLPGADEQALDRLRTLPQPFTASQARTALATSRRVVLPLLAHLDDAGLTRRLPDDRRVVV